MGHSLPYMVANNYFMSTTVVVNAISILFCCSESAFLTYLCFYCFLFFLGGTMDLLLSALKGLPDFGMSVRFLLELVVSP